VRVEVKNIRTVKLVKKEVYLCTVEVEWKNASQEYNIELLLEERKKAENSDLVSFKKSNTNIYLVKVW